MTNERTCETCKHLIRLVAFDWGKNEEVVQKHCNVRHLKCYIARFEGLCGPKGRDWEPKE